MTHAFVCEPRVGRFVPVVMVLVGLTLVVVVGRIASHLLHAVVDVETSVSVSSGYLRRMHTPTEPGINGSPIEITILHETDDDRVMIH